MNDCYENAGSPEGELLRRDNVRFSFWRNNGKPELPDNFQVDLGVTSTLHLIQQEKARVEEERKALETD